jgi:hypothetical protein
MMPSDAQLQSIRILRMLIHLSRQEYLLWAEDDSDIHILIHIGTIKPTHRAQRMAKPQHSDYYLQGGRDLKQQ